MAKNQDKKVLGREIAKIIMSDEKKAVSWKMAWSWSDRILLLFKRRDGCKDTYTLITGKKYP